MISGLAWLLIVAVLAPGIAVCVAWPLGYFPGTVGAKARKFNRLDYGDKADLVPATVGALKAYEPVDLTKGEPAATTRTNGTSRTNGNGNGHANSRRKGKRRKRNLRKNHR